METDNLQPDMTQSSAAAPKTMVVTINGKQFTIPAVDATGRALSMPEAIDNFKKTQGMDEEQAMMDSFNPAAQNPGPKFV
jgi:N-acetylglucosamine-6-phosphate deacetylase